MAEAETKLKFSEDLGEFGLSAGDKVIKDALTIRNLGTDRELVVRLLRAKIAPSDLQFCFSFLVTRGNRQDDHEILLNLLQAGVKAKDLPKLAQILTIDADI